ncbi:hypothetical protein TeGR_g12856 [Tetraparma gracilis]|uniref:Uncharacterized protein n=1 Tax=Tetraparma gracilis TaxID=2962635 RepID=A0ABQ6N2X1_9STRA|nr:hypothetical protein TeGR_g12856 [Tetraparma gracilis]
MLSPAPPPLTLSSACALLRLAGPDARVRAVHVTLPPEPLPLYASDRLRAALLDFQAHGRAHYEPSRSSPAPAPAPAPPPKSVYAAASSLPLSSLHLLLAAPPANRLLHPLLPAPPSPLSPSCTLPYFRGALLRAGVRPEFERRGRYKSAAAAFLRSAPTEDDVEAAATWLRPLHRYLLRCAGSRTEAGVLSELGLARRAFAHEAGGLVVSVADFVVLEAWLA